MSVPARLGRAARRRAAGLGRPSLASANSILSACAKMSQEDPVVVISSSPDFPSIHKLLTKSPKKSALRSGSNAAPIPNDALTSFATATTVWQSLHGGGGTRKVDISGTIVGDTVSKGVEALVIESEETKKGKPKKRATVTTAKKTKATATTETPSVPADQKTEQPILEPATAPKLRRKTKAAKNQDDAQTTIPQVKVTKTGAKERKPRKKTETVSRHFPQPAPPGKLVNNPVDDGPIALERAMPRRMDWTPPPDDTVSPPAGRSATLEEISVISLEDSVVSDPGRTETFKDMLGAYNCKVVEEVKLEGIPAQPSNDILGKRKLIEMAATTVDRAKTPATSPTKTKAPKKKPRTITELATAAYRTVEETSVEPETNETVLDYFDAENGTDDRKQAKAPSKTSKKMAKPKVSKKKAEPRKQVLLSPKSALKQVSGQDFVFGTASQLATEDDPDLLRALHEAMKASNIPDSDPFASSPILSELASRRIAGNKLWAAGARDDDGDLLDLEPLDLTESPAPLQNYSLPRLSTAAANGSGQSVSTREIPVELLSSELDTFDLSESPAVPPAAKSHFSSTRKIVNSKESGSIVKLPLSAEPTETVQPNVAIDLDFEPPPSNQEHNELITQSQVYLSPSKPPANTPQRPKYELFTDASLAKAIAAYGFKPIKKREAMIALLEQCWENKHKTKLGDTTAQGVMSAATVSQPKAAPTTSAPRSNGRAKKAGAAVPPTDTAPRPRGRPKKNPEAAAEQAFTKPARGRPRMQASPAPTKEVVEIADSDASDRDDDPFLSSPISSPKANDDLFSSSPHPPMDVSITEETEDASLIATEGPTTQQAMLFSLITKAVTSAPRTTNPAEPSWHEKILMYDPVILEDLTAWLNSGQLDRVGHDEEVTPNDVKLWCHSKSVCCLWRENLHGKARKRF